jgi:hypothetical protein
MDITMMSDPYFWYISTGVLLITYNIGKQVGYHSVIRDIANTIDKE